MTSEMDVCVAVLKQFHAASPSFLPQLVQKFAELCETGTFIIAVTRTHCVNINSQLDATIIILLIISISSTCFG